MFLNLPAATWMWIILWIALWMGPFFIWRVMVTKK